MPLTNSQDINIVEHFFGPGSSENFDSMVDAGNAMSIAMPLIHNNTYTWEDIKNTRGELSAIKSLVLQSTNPGGSDKSFRTKVASGGGTGDGTGDGTGGGTDSSLFKDESSMALVTGADGRRNQVFSKGGTAGLDFNFEDGNWVQGSDDEGFDTLTNSITGDWIRFSHYPPDYEPILSSVAWV